jgi:hypothetical protein
LKRNASPLFIIAGISVSAKPHRARKSTTFCWSFFSTHDNSWIQPTMYWSPPRWHQAASMSTCRYHPVPDTFTFSHWQLYNNSHKAATPCCVAPTWPLWRSVDDKKRSSHPPQPSPRRTLRIFCIPKSHDS